MKYRKKPIIVEATQWNKHGDHVNVRPHHDDGRPLTWRCPSCNFNIMFHGEIDTLEGTHIVCPEDYIITGIKGEQYPCKPDIFEATYDEVEDENEESR